MANPTVAEAQRHLLEAIASYGSHHDNVEGQVFAALALGDEVLESARRVLEDDDQDDQAAAVFASLAELIGAVHNERLDLAIAELGGLHG